VFTAEATIGKKFSRDFGEGGGEKGKKVGDCWGGGGGGGMRGYS